MSLSTSGSGPQRPTGARGIVGRTLLWAGPLGIGLAILLLVLSAPWFRSGPGVPTAGDGRAWAAMWSALGLVALGCCVGFVANLAWLAIAIRARRRPTRLEWVRTSAGLLLGVAFGFLWLRP